MSTGPSPSDIDTSHIKVLLHRFNSTRFDTTSSPDEYQGGVCVETTEVDTAVINIEVLRMVQIFLSLEFRYFDAHKLHCAERNSAKIRYGHL